MNNYFVIFAAGKSKRFQKYIAKKFHYYRNKVIDHSIDNIKFCFSKDYSCYSNLNHFKKEDQK